MVDTSNEIVTTVKKNSYSSIVHVHVHITTLCFLNHSKSSFIFYTEIIWSRGAGLWTRSLFLSFVLPSVFHSVFLPLLAHQLLGFGWEVLPSARIYFFFVLLPPLVFASYLFSWRCCALTPRLRDKLYA